MLELTKDNLARLVEALPPYVPDGRSAYHHTLSLVLSQRVRFKVGQRVRGMLYVDLGEGKLDNLFRKMEEKPDYVDQDKWDIMHRVHDAWPDISDVKGIGPWTRQCALHMAGKHTEGGFVSGDKAIQNLLLTIFGAGTRYRDMESMLEPEQAGLLFAGLWQLSRCPVHKRRSAVRKVLHGMK